MIFLAPSTQVCIFLLGTENVQKLLNLKWFSKNLFIRGISIVRNSKISYDYPKHVLFLKQNYLFCADNLNLHFLPLKLHKYN